MNRSEGVSNFVPKHEGLREKPQERLQAQAEIFADKKPKEFSEDQARLLQYSAELSKIKDLDNLPADLPAELVDLIAKHKKSYVNFLRQERKLETSFVEENIKNYNEKFRSAVAELKTKMAQGNPKELPEYLGSGSNGSAFRLEVAGKTYAAKFSRSIVQSNFELKPLLRAKDISHTSQLVGYSFEDGVVIMELLPGTDISNFTAEDAPEYSDEDIVQLIDTVRELNAKGLVIDPKPSNFMYDKEQGFSVLDYHLQQSGNNYTLPQQIISLKNVLSERKTEQLDYQASDYEEKAKVQDIERYKIVLPMLVRFLGILKEKYPDILAEWQRDRDERRKNPNERVGEIVERKYIPQHPDFVPHLTKLEKMGF